MQEIERKFLVRKELLPGCLKPTVIAQGYLNSSPECTVRVRIAGDSAYLTIKGPSSEDGLSRLEVELAIEVEVAYCLLPLCEPGMIAKKRYHMVHKGKLWEIDFFEGDNAGLWVAEIELSSTDEKVDLPEWVGEEVTGDVRYYNSQLAKRPFTTW
jgi:adenylate cyclase